MKMLLGFIYLKNVLLNVWVYHPTGKRIVKVIGLKIQMSRNGILRSKFGG